MFLSLSGQNPYLARLEVSFHHHFKTHPFHRGRRSGGGGVGDNKNHTDTVLSVSEIWAKDGVWWDEEEEVKEEERL